MAEATVENLAGEFYCHECMRAVQPNIPAFTCSRCNSGFIEEMEQEEHSPSQSSADPHSSDSFTQFAEMLGASFIEPVSHHRYNARLSRIDVDMEDDETAPSTVIHITSGDLPQIGNQANQTVHGIINYVIQRLGDELGGRTPIILRGNPGDYAWGPNGLDAIISQLLNHLEGTGAPPAQKEKIENLARIVIGQSHIDKLLQCSICMDDFELAMEVRKLPCDHLYHSECIVRWLEMHGTCPVCRKDLNGEDTSTNEAEFIPDFSLIGNENNNTASASSSASAPMEIIPPSVSDIWRN